MVRPANEADAVLRMPSLQYAPVAPFFNAVSRRPAASRTYLSPPVSPTVPPSLASQPPASPRQIFSANITMLVPYALLYSFGSVLFLGLHSVTVHLGLVEPLGAVPGAMKVLLASGLVQDALQLVAQRISLPTLPDPLWLVHRESHHQLEKAASFLAAAVGYPVPLPALPATHDFKSDNVLDSSSSATPWCTSKDGVDTCAFKYLTSFEWSVKLYDFGFDVAQWHPTSCDVFPLPPGLYTLCTLRLNPIGEGTFLPTLHVTFEDAFYSVTASSLPTDAVYLDDIRQAIYYDQAFYPPPSSYLQGPKHSPMDALCLGIITPSRDLSLAAFSLRYSVFLLRTTLCSLARLSLNIHPVIMFLLIQVLLYLVVEHARAIWRRRSVKKVGIDPDSPVRSRSFLPCIVQIQDRLECHNSIFRKHHCL